jgi:V/A-type H+-transporting ATPase subunit E
MKGLETGKDKIQKICDALRKETLEPARHEAKEIIDAARNSAAHLLQEAKAKAQDTLNQAVKEIEERKKVFESSLMMACRQGIEELKATIEEKFFNSELKELVEKEMGDPKTIAKILNAFLETLEEKGVDDELVVKIPKSITPRSINALLAQKVIDKLEKGEVAEGDFAGGVQIELKDRKITIDISEKSVRELIAQYIRRDFRDLVFNV